MKSRGVKQQGEAGGAQAQAGFPPAGGPCRPPPTLPGPAGKGAGVVRLVLPIAHTMRAHRVNIPAEQYAGRVD